MLIMNGYEWQEITAFADLPKRVFVKGDRTDEDDTPLGIGQTITPSSRADGLIILELEQ